ncbi:MAG: RNA 2',3'-cyclic phosphodiesterase [Desulfovibrio sp.]|uniref:RNA 2',3'-cyclic phosphodiesterase n=1 Tax=Desulfovibrio sp. 7SRBS1 TaxID=3378064 RepID=UPI003B3D4BEC
MGTQSVYRLFIGISMGEECLERLRELRSRLADRLPDSFRWVRPENWHITLRFLGDTPCDRLDFLQEALAGVRFETFLLQPGGGGFFPSPARPSVCWVGVRRGVGECTRLAECINAALVQAGWSGGAGEGTPAKPFRPHLTIGRMGRGAHSHGAKKGPWAEIARDLEMLKWPEVPVDRFTLWRSELGPGGPRYTALFSCTAQGASLTGNRPG